MKVSAQYAQEHFPDLVDAAYSGEPVEIAVPDKPALFLAPRPEQSEGTQLKRPFADLLGVWEGQTAQSFRPRAELLGAGEGLIQLPTDEEWRAMDKEIEEEMLNGPIFPPEHP